VPTPSSGLVLRLPWAAVSTSGTTDALPRTAVVLLAAGEGRRVGAGSNKVLLPLLGEPVFLWSLRSALELPGTVRVVLVIRPGDRAAVDRGLELAAAHHPGAEVLIVAGGQTRHGSEWNALSAVARPIDAGEVDVVAIHDTARPLADVSLFAAVTRAANVHGGALPVRRQNALVPRGPEPVQHSELVGVQTPQAFRARPLLAAYRAAATDGFVGTDTASCVERYTDLEIHCVEAPATNVKITFPVDVRVAEQLLRR
jgi:2-C-methyl-D-erythritol 4-phosphate cytidylyltransferase